MEQPDGERCESFPYDVLLKLVERRRSVRRFLPEPVPTALVEQVIEVARLSPSAANSQPWEFIVVTRPEVRQRIARASSSVFRDARKKDPAFEWSISVQPFLSQAPVLVLILGDKRMLAAYPSILRGNVLLRQSLAICAYSLQLAASGVGLGTAWGTLQGGPAEMEIRELLGIPNVFTIDHIIPLGYPDEEESRRAEALRPARERGARRRPRSEIIHWEHFESARFRSDAEAERFVWQETVTRVSRNKGNL